MIRLSEISFVLLLCLHICRFTCRYATHKPSDTTTSGVDSKATPKRSTTTSYVDLSAPDPNAKAQLDLLSHLIGSGAAKQSSGFRINLFNNDEEEE